MRQSFVRISALVWAEVLVGYALFVMQNYFTDVWKLSLTHAAAILNFWNGIYRILPVLFLYFVDSFLGHFNLLVFTSVSNSVGIVLVSMSPPPVLAKLRHTCKEYEPRCIGRAQEILIYAGLALIAVGIAGNLASVKPLLVEQRDETALGGNVWQALGLVCVVAVGVSGKIIPYLQPWTLRFGIPAICSVVITLLFLSGSSIYKKKPPNPKGSPLCSVCRVFVAAALKIFKAYPDDNERYHGINEKRFSSTNCLRVLHKAAIIEENGVINRWKLCTVAEVEDAKIAVRMVPIWMTFIVCGIVSSAGDTYFVEQAGKLNRRMGKIKLPIEVLLLARMSAKILFGVVVKRILKWKHKDIAPSFGIALGMIFSVLCCVSAACTERMRLKVVRRDDLLDKADEDVAMSIYWLLFQFFLLGGLDSLLEKSVNAFYRVQSPDSMEAYVESFTHYVSGLGYMSSTLSVYVVGRISERGGRRNWFQRTLNESRLDRYYWLLAALSSVNLAVYVVVASRYRYKKPGGEGEGELEAGGSSIDGNAVLDDATKSFCCCFESWIR